MTCRHGETLTGILVAQRWSPWRRTEVHRFKRGGIESGQARNMQRVLLGRARLPMLAGGLPKCLVHTDVGPGEGKLPKKISLVA